MNRTAQIMEDVLHRGLPPALLLLQPVSYTHLGTPSDGVLKIKDQAYPAGLHGFLHSFPWRVQNCKTDQLTLVMESDDELARCYPFAFHGKMTITLSENGLTSAMEITNDFGAIMPCDLGMHPFFLIGDYDALTLDFQEMCIRDRYWSGNKRFRHALATA